MSITAKQPISLSPELATYQSQRLAARERIAKMAAGLTKEQFNFRREPRRWSVAQNIDHLNRAAELLFLPVVERLVERGLREGITANGPFRHP